MHEWTDRQGRKRRLYCLEGAATPLQYEHELRGQWRQAATAEPLMDELLRLAEENAALKGDVGTLRRRYDEAEMLMAELIGALGLDREAIDRDGEPVGNAILTAVRKAVADVAYI